MKNYTSQLCIIVLTATIWFLPGCVGEHNSVGTQDLLDTPWEAGAFPADSVRSLLMRHVQSDLVAGQELSPDIRESISSFYAGRNNDPAWIDEGEIKPHAEAFLKDLCNVDLDGLLVSDYRPDVIADAMSRYFLNPTPTSLVDLDLVLTWSFMQYSKDLMGGRVNPETLRSEVYLTAPKTSPDSVLASILSQDPPESFGETLRPRHAHYQELRDQMERYREISARGGWPTLKADSDEITIGSSGPNVALLIERLATSGDLDRSDLDDTVDIYTEAVAAGVARFQVRHGIAADSIVDVKTLAALNVSVEERIAQIERNLERWRWLPANLGDRYIYVNIPAFLVYGFINGEEALKMRVVVGSEYGDKQTPVFRDEMDRVIFRPYWNVPDGIAADEIIPKAKSDPSWLTRNHYEILERDSGRIVPFDEIDLSEVPSAKYRIRQTPGSHNALGLVKYIFPNRHGIYLHDTPSDHLFDRIERDFSHGCIRLENPDVLGHHILGDHGWTLDDVREAINGEERRVVLLDEKIPVYLMYNTAYVQDGVMHFREDIYGYDAALEESLTPHKKRYSNLTLETGRACGNLRLLRHAL